MTFENLNVWLEQIEDRCPEYAVRILVATKSDLKRREGMFGNSEQVIPEEGQDFAEQHNMLFHEVTVKEQESIEQLFCSIVD